MKPLIIQSIQFNQNAYLEYDLSFTFPHNGEDDALMARITAGRSDTVQACKEAARLARPGDDGIPKTPIWGPVVLGEIVISDRDITQHYRLVPLGMESRFESTDGKEAKQVPPPLPSQGVINYPNRSYLLPLPCQPSPKPVDTRKLFIIRGDYEEVTLDELTEAVIKEANIKVIRGEVVDPKLKVEIWSPL